METMRSRHGRISIMNHQRSVLEKELVELFDIKKSKKRDEKLITQQAMEAQKDIRLLTLMFSDGIPDMDIPMSDSEQLLWDSRNKRLLYSVQGRTMFLEGAGTDVIIRIRPYLMDLVKK